jgi:hypothetical protein
MPLTIVQGIVAGIVAGIVMAIFMMAMSKGRPVVPARVVARARGKKPEEGKMGGMAAHFLYSTLMGVIFVLGSEQLRIDGFLGLEGYWVNGILFGLVLFLVLGAVAMPAGGITKEMRKMMPKSQMVGMFLLHILYGLVLVASITWIPVA